MSNELEKGVARFEVRGASGSPVEEDAGGVVLEDGDLVRAEIDWHALRCALNSGVNQGKVADKQCCADLSAF